MTQREKCVEFNYEVDAKRAAFEVQEMGNGRILILVRNDGLRSGEVRLESTSGRSLGLVLRDEKKRK